MIDLSKIVDAGFTLELDGNDLVIEPFSMLTQSQLAFLKTHKAEIITILQLEQEVNDAPDPFDDRHYCHECRNLINSKCDVQRFRPHDDIPRRCPDYLGWT